MLFNPEDNLILACLQQQPIIPKLDFNEECLIHRMGYHRVTSMVYQHLLNIDGLGIFSGKTQAQFKKHYQLNIGRNLAINYLTKKLSNILKAHNIEIMTFKGAMLIQSFPNYALVREMSDLDIIVKFEKIAQALDILSTAGFKSSTDLQSCQNKRKKWYLLNLSNAIPLRSTQLDIPDIMVELHWRLFSILNKTYWPEEHLWQRAKYCSDQGVYHLDPIDVLLHLCAHQCNDLQIYLYGLIDVAYILRYWGDKIDWIELISRAKSRRVLLHLVNILRLGHEILNTPLPALYSACLKPYEPQAEPGYHLLLERLFKKEVTESVPETISICRVFRRLENSTFWQRLWYETTSFIPMAISLRLGYYISRYSNPI